MTNSFIELSAIKLGLLGDSSVGKTSICLTYTGIEFKQDILSTIGADKFEKKITLKNGKTIKLILWDTAGQERFRSAAFKAIRAVNAIVLVFDVTCINTFQNIDKWLQEINDNFDNPIIILLGNKADIEDERKVSKEEIEIYTKKKNLMYFETSAKTGQGINEGFSYIANETYDKIIFKTNNNIQIMKEDEYEIINGCFGKKKIKKKKINQK